MGRFLTVESVGDFSGLRRQAREDSDLTEQTTYINRAVFSVNTIHCVLYACTARIPA